MLQSQIILLEWETRKNNTIIWEIDTQNCLISIRNYLENLKARTKVIFGISIRQNVSVKMFFMSPAPLCVQCGKFTIVYPDNYLATRVSMEVIVTTLPKTNIAPENGWLAY